MLSMARPFTSYRSACGLGCVFVCLCVCVCVFASQMQLDGAVGAANNWVNYNDLPRPQVVVGIFPTRPHPKWWNMWGISPQPPYFRLVKNTNSPRNTRDHDVLEQECIMPCGTSFDQETLVLLHFACAASALSFSSVCVFFLGGKVTQTPTAPQEVVWLRPASAARGWRFVRYDHPPSFRIPPALHLIHAQRATGSALSWRYQGGPLSRQLRGRHEMAAT